jgi:hypothetical protein
MVRPPLLSGLDRDELAHLPGKRRDVVTSGASDCQATIEHPASQVGQAMETIQGMIAVAVDAIGFREIVVSGLFLLVPFLDLGRGEVVAVDALTQKIVALELIVRGGRHAQILACAGLAC